uniref:Excision repair cross-complementation group 1 n=1 Tax=Cyprinus carpio TaxID=7962 RepID=A0A8C2JH35_CYPCA
MWQCFLHDLLFTQVASLFKSKDGQVKTSSALSAPPATVLCRVCCSEQKQGSSGQGPAHGPEKQSRSDAAGQSSVNTAGSGSVSTSSTDSEKPETEQQGPEKVPTEDQTKEESQSSESCIIPPHLLGTGNGIIVSPRQRGNPILKFERNVPWEFGEVVPDYVLGRTTCALFISVRYQYLNPNYIHEHLKQLCQSFTLRVLHKQVDVKDPHHALKELVTDCLTTVKSVNKTDAMTLLFPFSVRNTFPFKCCTFTVLLTLLFKRLRSVRFFKRN